MAESFGSFLCQQVSMVTLGSISIINEVIDIDILLRKWANKNPEKLALADSTHKISWFDLDHTCNKIASALIISGIQPNERIAILGANSVDYVLLFFGALRAGACVTPLSGLASANSLAGMINDSESKLLFVSQAYARMIEPIADQLPTLMANGIKNLDYEGDGRESLASFTKTASTNEVELPISLDWGFNLIYSSGTTGNPKGILQNRLYRAIERQGMAELGLNHLSRTLFSTPLYSNTTLFLLLSVLGNGGTVFLMEKFDTQRFLKISETDQITHTVLVPIQYERLLNDVSFDLFDLSSYQLKFCTSAPLHINVKEEILKRWPEGGLIEAYGMTEGGIGCLLFAHERPDKLDTVGQPALGCEMKIINDAGQVLPQGEIGEIVGHSSRMMDGYVNRPEATEEASWFDSEGRRYQKSGDIGWFDKEGFLHLLDRKKDMIISGGFNIYAIDLERVLLGHPDISDVAVVAARSEQWGETPVAFVVCRKEHQINPEELRHWANQLLGKAQRISQVRFIEKLPRSSIGKVLKRELRNLV